MAWIKGIVIRDGELQGSTIGISNLVPQTGNILNTNYCGSIYETIEGQSEYFYNTDFEKQLDISSFLASGHAVYSDLKIASIAIKNENTVTGYFSFYLTFSGGSPITAKISGKIENASGVVIGSMRGSPVTLNWQNPSIYSSYAELKAYLCFAETEVNGHKLVSMYVNANQTYNAATLYAFRIVGFAGQDMNVIYSQWGISGNIDDDVKTKSPEFGKASEPAGGYNPGGTHGTFDDSSDIVPVPHLPTKGVTSAGFINVYVIENDDLVSLGEKLFPHFLPAELLKDPSQMTVPEMLAAILKSFFGTLLCPVGSTIEFADNVGIIDILMNGKLIDYVLDCHIIPTAISGATVEGLKVGYRQFNDLQLAKATTDYVEIDCGSLSIGEYWGNFLDYSCTVKLFLPFVGFVPIENEYWNGGTIKVIYHFNIIDGSFQAYVVATSSKSELSETVIAQYGGVCCVHMPITGLQYSNVVAGLVNGTAGAVASGYGGDVAGAVTNALNMAMLRPDAPSSNGYNASSSFLSERKPYLLIERPTSQFSEMYDKEMGLPLNVMRTLSTVHGFTVIDNPVLHISCSDSEYQELVSLLKNGVILP